MKSLSLSSNHPGPSLTMAGSIIERIKLVLPRELCVLIYSFTFFVDFGPIEKLQNEEILFEITRFHLEPLVCKCRNIFSTDKPEHHRSDAPWPEHVEEAFSKGNAFCDPVYE